MNKDLEKIIKQAEKEMKLLNHPYVGSEHLLLALLKNNEVIKICNDYDLTYNIFKTELINVIGTSNIKTEKVLHTPLLKTIITSSKKDAKENNNGIVTSNHLLLSIIECGDGIGVRILLSLGIDLEGLYKDLKKHFNPVLNSITKYGKDLSINDTILLNREKELETIIEILLRKNKNNPLLIGESGVGKTAIVEGLATKLKNNEIEELKGYKICSIDMSLLLSGSKYRGDFEERLNTVIKETINEKNIILFVDEIHTIVNAGGSEGAIDAANILKPYLSRGELKIIGATTIEEYNKYIKKDKALIRRFDAIEIKEPNNLMTKDILYKLKNNYKKYHNINITNKNLDMILEYSNRYIFDKKNPDKTIDILDSVCSYVNLKKRKTITKKDIEEIISRKINKKINNTKDTLININKQIYGQDDAIKEILNILENDKNFKTILLVGGIGVGKTLSIKTICNELCLNFVNIDMAEYSNYYSINNIFNGDNSLYNTLSNNSIILFDNIEKCNPNILNIILKIIDDKRIKDKDLSNSTIFLTATNKLVYNIGFNKELNEIEYSNKDVLERINYIIKYDNINKEVVTKYINDNNITNFDYDKCDYKNFGFRGIKISLKTKDLIK